MNFRSGGPPHALAAALATIATCLGLILGAIALLGADWSTLSGTESTRPASLAPVSARRTAPFCRVLLRAPSV
jgi:hypothetical protein